MNSAEHWGRDMDKLRSALHDKGHRYDALLESFISQALELYGLGKDLGPDAIKVKQEAGGWLFYDTVDRYLLTHWDAMELMARLYHMPAYDRVGYFWDAIGRFENLNSEE